MGDEGFAGKVGDVDFALLCKPVLWRHDQRQLVFQNLGGLELGIARHKGNGAEIETVIQDLVGNIAGKHAVNAQLDPGMQFAKFGEGGKKRVNGAFAEALFDLVAEVDETFGVIPEQCAGIGQADGASAANEERLAERILELADGQTDGRLRAVKTLGSAREAAVLCDGQQHLDLREIHTSSWLRVSAAGKLGRTKARPAKRPRLECPATNSVGTAPAA